MADITFMLAVTLPFIYLQKGVSMIRRKLLVLGTAICLAVSANAITSFADTTSASTTTMENCGAYLFEWRPIDCGNGNYFAILVGGNTLNESNVILNRGYDYAYTFEPMTYSRPWGTVPDLVNIDGKWGIPENWSSMPEGAQPTLQIVLKTNYKTLNTDKRYVNVVHLPSNVNSSTLPAEVRKYLINVDASDAGAYNDTVTQVAKRSRWIRKIFKARWNVCKQRLAPA